jgi:hypothetical protein
MMAMVGPDFPEQAIPTSRKSLLQDLLRTTLAI